MPALKCEVADRHVRPPCLLPSVHGQVFSRYQEYRQGKDMVIVEGTTVSTA